MGDSGNQAMGESGINHSELYGHYQKQTDIDNNRNNAKKDWKDRVYQQTVMKGLNLAMTDEEKDDMNLDASRRVSNSGLTWQHLAVIALGGLGAFKLLQPPQPTVVPQTVPVVTAPNTQQQQLQPIKQDYETQILIRDAVTKQPIRVDWLNSDGTPAQPPKPNETKSGSSAPNVPPLFVPSSK